MKRFLILGAMLLLAFPVAARAADTQSSMSANGKPQFDASEKVTAEATVLSVNSKTRHVKVRNADGDTVVIECGPEIKNFAKIQPKDIVKVTYTERLKVTVEGPGTAELTSNTSTTEAKLGEQPKGTITSVAQHKATITSIDKPNNTVMLKAYDGKEYPINPRVPANIDKVKVGDMVVFTYTVAVAVQVDKPAAAKPAAKPAATTTTTKK